MNPETMPTIESVPVTAAQPAPAAENVPPTPPQASPVEVVRHKRVTAKKPDKEKKEPKVKLKPQPATMFNAALAELVRNLRKNPKWIDLRLQYREVEAIEKLIRQQPAYAWRKVGQAHYLRAEHTSEEATVAYILPHSPKDDYKRAVSDYKLTLQNPRIKNKGKEPKKPASFKRDFQWRIPTRRGFSELEGVEPTLQAAQAAIERRKQHFVA